MALVQPPRTAVLRKAQREPFHIGSKVAEAMAKIEFIGNEADARLDAELLARKAALEKFTEEFGEPDWAVVKILTTHLIHRVVVYINEGV